MLSDMSPNHVETWNFLRRRIEDVVRLEQVSIEVSDLMTFIIYVNTNQTQKSLTMAASGLFSFFGNTLGRALGSRQ